MDDAEAADLSQRFDNKWTHVMFLEDTPDGPRCADPRGNGPDGLALPGLLELLEEADDITRRQLERERREGEGQVGRPAKEKNQGHNPTASG